MRLSGSRFTMGFTALMIGAASVVFAIGGGDHAIAGAATSSASISAGPSQIVVQTMDSCKSGLGGARYELDDASGHVIATAGSQGASSPGSVTGGVSCTLQQGDCVNTTKGCLVFAAVPAGDYRLRQIAVPSGNSTNPDGYAPCNSGSACQWESADVTVNGDGSILAAVTNVAPNGISQQFPNAATGLRATYFAGTASDPVVFHNFGLAKPGTINGGTGLPNVQCDADGDADDWSTGTPSSRCGFPEAAETTVCTTPTQFMTAAEGAQPSWTGTTFPWQCLKNPVATPAHLTSAILGGPQSVTALSTFQVTVLGGSTTTLVSAEDPGMRVTPNSMGFAVSLDPVRTVAGKKTVGGQITSGTVTITPEGGQGNALVVSVGPPTANANYIENLYHDVLGRYGFPEEIGYWSAKMDAGMTRGQMAQTFSMTPEFLGHMVDSDFQSMVGSAPAANDPGRAFWVNFLTNLGNNDTLIGSLGASSSYYTQAGGTDAGFITSLYSRVLHRSTGPSPADIQYWAAYGPFAGSLPARLQVANNFAYSTEQHASVARGWYQTFLGRGPDGPGLAYWTGNLDHGVLQQVMVNSFIASDEFYSHAPKY